MAKKCVYLRYYTWIVQTDRRSIPEPTRRSSRISAKAGPESPARTKKATRKVGRPKKATSTTSTKGKSALAIKKSTSPAESKRYVTFDVDEELERLVDQELENEGRDFGNEWDGFENIDDAVQHGGRHHYHPQVHVPVNQAHEDKHDHWFRADASNSPASAIQPNFKRIEFPKHSLQTLRDLSSPQQTADNQRVYANTLSYPGSSSSSTSPSRSRSQSLHSLNDAQSETHSFVGRPGTPPYGGSRSSSTPRRRSQSLRGMNNTPSLPGASGIFPDTLLHQTSSASPSSRRSNSTASSTRSISTRRLDIEAKLSPSDLYDHYVTRVGALMVIIKAGLDKPNS
ncbi:hypothetical protein LTS18_012077, partial [Coniosporium uncinatum]